MELTKIERLILFNQHKILEKLDPPQAEYYKERCEILENGYALEYDELVKNFGDGLTEDECREVRDILEMHRVLHDAYQGFENAGGIQASDVSFRGFDENNESEYLGYARFLIETQGKWQEMKQSSLNSHGPTLQRYRRMLDRWNACEKPYNLDEHDVARIVDKN